MTSRDRSEAADALIDRCFSDGTIAKNDPASTIDSDPRFRERLEPDPCFRGRAEESAFFSAARTPRQDVQTRGRSDRSQLREMTLKSVEERVASSAVDRTHPAQVASELA